MIKSLLNSRERRIQEISKIDLSVTLVSSFYLILGPTNFIWATGSDKPGDNPNSKISKHTAKGAFSLDVNKANTAGVDGARVGSMVVAGVAAGVLGMFL